MAWNETVDRYLRGDIEAGRDLVADTEFQKLVQRMAREQCLEMSDDAAQYAFEKIIGTMDACKFIRRYCLTCLQSLECEVLEKQPPLGLDQITTMPSTLRDRLIPTVPASSLYLCFNQTIEDCPPDLYVLEIGIGCEFLIAMLDLIQQDYAAQADLNPASRLKSWMKRVARNHLKDFRRRQPRFEQLSENFEDDRDFRQILEDQELVEQVLSAIARLDRQYPGKGYLLWAERKIQERSEQEIAAELGIKPVEMTRRKKELIIQLAYVLERITEEKRNELWKRRRTIRSDEIW